MKLPDWFVASSFFEHVDDFRNLVQPVGEFRFLTVLDLPQVGDLYRLKAYITRSSLANIDTFSRHAAEKLVGADAATCLFAATQWTVVDEALAFGITKSMRNDAEGLMARCEFLRAVNGCVVPLFDGNEIDETIGKIKDKWSYVERSDTRLRDLL